MSHNLLKGKRGIIFGALNDMSIAWKVAERAVEEGATITLSNTPIAVRMGQVDALAEKLNAQVIPADATSVEDLETVFAKSVEILGGKIDFVLHSIGMSPNVRKKRTYDDLDYGMLEKTLDISAISFHKMLQVAKKQDAIAENGSVVALSYVAAQRTFFGYNDMADAKSLLESIARSFGYIYGREKGVRVNTISQSPTMTTAGSGVKGMEHLMDFSNKMSPLGNANGNIQTRTDTLSTANMLVRIYPENPNQKEIDKVVKVLQDGGLVVYPTDTVYAIGCDALNVRAVEKICQMKGVNPQKSNLSIICYDLSNLSEYAKVSNAAFKLMKKHLPGPFTFILPTSSELPKIYKNRKEVGIRVPDNNITRTLVQSLGNPILTMSIRDKDEVIEYTTDPELIHEKYEHQVDIVIDGGFGGLEASTVIDCTTDNFEIVRQGKGEL